MASPHKVPFSLAMSLAKAWYFTSLVLMDTIRGYIHENCFFFMGCVYVDTCLTVPEGEVLASQARVNINATLHVTRVLKTKFRSTRVLILVDPYTTAVLVAPLACIHVLFFWGTKDY
jgi:hypothetical protein